MTRQPPDTPAADVARDSGSADTWFVARNRVQRVDGRACRRCGGAVLRARRGPVPQYCVDCEVLVRQTRQLRAYLRCAERLAREIGRPSVSRLAHEAVAACDAEVGP